MTLIVLIGGPPSLSGWLSRWMVEPAPGVFVSCLNQAVREVL